MSRNSTPKLTLASKLNKEKSASRQVSIGNKNTDNSQEHTVLAAKRRMSQEKLQTPSAPLYRASSNSPISNLRSTKWTPSTSRKHGSVKRPVTLTPHGRAAQRELYLRSGLSMGGYRRRSGNYQQRETPRDNLRALSRLLAGKSQKIKLSPQISTPKDDAKEEEEEEEEEEESELIKPRLSLALGPDDEDDSFILPPESAGLEDENITIKSIEYARRAVSEEPTRRLSRGSYGSIRMSDVFTKSSAVGLRADYEESSYLVDVRREDTSFLPNTAEDDEILIDDTATLKFTAADEGRYSPKGRESAIPQAHPNMEENDTFVLTVPTGESFTLARPSEILSASDLQIQESFENQSPPDDTKVSLQGTLTSRNSDLNMRNTRTQRNSPKNPEVRKVLRKNVNFSRYGIPYPSLPTQVVRRLAIKFAKTTGNSRPRINKEALEAIIQASNWFFEQASDDLRAYAKHAGRKTIEDSDIITLMRRQRQINSTTTLFFLAQRYLSRELLQELRMATHTTLK